MHHENWYEAVYRELCQTHTGRREAAKAEARMKEKWAKGGTAKIQQHDELVRDALFRLNKIFKRKSNV